MYKNTFDKLVVKTATFRFNIILIEFNDDMNKDKNKSYLKACNYAIQKNKEIISLSNLNAIIEVKKGYIIKIILKEILNPKFEILNIHLGYIYLNEIFYIENENGLIPYPFNKKKLDYVEELSLENGILKLINEKTINFEYKGNNKFLNISNNDFYIEKNGIKYFTNNTNFDDKTKISFTFNKHIFDDISSNLYLNVIKNPKSVDIYGFKIKGNLSIKIYDDRETFINNFSFCNYENKTAFLKISFSKPILYFYPSDFIVKYSNKTYKIRYIESTFNKTIIHIAIDDVNIKYLMENIFQFFTCVKYEFIKTLDYRGKKVFINKEVNSKYFIASSINWDIDKYCLGKSKIKINFNDNILPTSLITNCNFNKEKTAWQGERLIIPKYKLIVDKLDYNIILSLNYNESFGKIVIEGKNLGIIEKTSNKKDAFLILDDKGVFIKFSEKEDFLNLFYINTIKYYPSYNIRSIKGYYIFFGICPSFKIETRDTINVSALVSSEDNPFNGGVKKFNYIINVDNINKYREYGSNITTIITGYLKIIGDLDSYEGIIIKNLHVLGKTSINVKKGNVVLEGIFCNEIIYN